jgi:quinol monooxygenase YgiN
MITVVVSLPIRPDQRRRFVTDVVPLILNNPKPDGNLSVECFESVGATGDFLLLEQWSSQQAMDAWLRSDRFVVVTGAYRDLLAGPPAAAQLTGSLTPAPA